VNFLSRHSVTFRSPAASNLLDSAAAPRWKYTRG